MANRTDSTLAEVDNTFRPTSPTEENVGVKFQEYIERIWLDRLGIQVKFAGVMQCNVMQVCIVEVLLCVGHEISIKFSPKSVSQTR